jgi:hypothetical protein
MSLRCIEGIVTGAENGNLPSGYHIDPAFSWRYLFD